jgi:hypothetical protein
VVPFLFLIWSFGVPCFKTMASYNFYYHERQGKTKEDKLEKVKDAWCNTGTEKEHY